MVVEGIELVRLDAAHIHDEARFAGDLAAGSYVRIGFDDTECDGRIAAPPLCLSREFVHADDELRRCENCVSSRPARRGAGMGIGAEAARSPVARATADAGY